MMCWVVLKPASRLDILSDLKARCSTRKLLPRFGKVHLTD